MVKGITSRFVMLMALAAVAPLVVYGIVSIDSLRAGTQQSVERGNLNVAARAAEQIELYITNNVKILQAVGADLQGTHLEPWQQDRIVKNYVLEFPEFREITLLDATGRPVVSSRIGTPRLLGPRSGIDAGQNITISPLLVDDDLLPRTTIAIRLHQDQRVAGWLVGELSLEQLWRMVDQIRVGTEGFALVAAQDGQLIAHGRPDAKSRVARGENLRGHPLLETLATGLPGGASVQQYHDETGVELLGAAAGIASLGWTVMVEQPTTEAFAVAIRLERQLMVAIALALLIMIVTGYLFGRSLIRPIFTLMRGTRAIAEGRLSERVQIASGDEFERLGADFNRMADRVVELQENVRRQERQAMFGRIAVGLVHDISHPIQNIGNSCKLIVKMFDDFEYRETFKRTVERELAIVKRVLDDLRNVARPIPLERYPLDVSRSIVEVVETMRPHADAAGVQLELHASEEPAFITGDVFALGRVYRNLILNAIQATAPGGAVAVRVGTADGRVQVRIADTGCGIPADRLGAIFDDFVTTKRRGLGLGLAISRKIVEQLEGTIGVQSEVGRGTEFVLDFPRIPARPLAVAAAR